MINQAVERAMARRAALISPITKPVVVVRGVRGDPDVVLMSAWRFISDERLAAEIRNETPGSARLQKMLRLQALREKATYDQ